VPKQAPNPIAPTNNKVGNLEEEKEIFEFVKEKCLMQ
jgi:hypothetical protein